MVMEEDTQMNEYMKKTQLLIEENETEVADLVWGLEDTNNTWDNQIDAINLKLYQKAVEHGIQRDNVATHFNEFNIIDMIKTASTCN